MNHKNPPDFGPAFIELSEKYSKNSTLFYDFKIKISVFEESLNGIKYLSQDGISRLYSIANDTFFKNSVPMFQSLYTYYSLENKKPLFSGISQELEKEIMDTSLYLIPLLTNAQNMRQEHEKSVSIALKTLKDNILPLAYKKIGLISSWIVKWAGYIQQENTFRPHTLKTYRQGEVVLVEFGFRIGNEMGGRHYAVVVERNNNPRSGTILLSPISSYSIGNSPNTANVDLGVGAINNSRKGSEIIVNQTGYFSKMRIERPKNSSDTIGKINNEKMNELFQKLNNKISKK